MEWNGRDDDGNAVPDGLYRYAVKATDRAGNIGGSAPLEVRVDTRTTPLSLAVDPPYFSPNDDGVKDSARLAAPRELAWDG